MRKTNPVEVSDTSICVTMSQFVAMLGCGRATANKIATEAKAKIKIGRRVLVKVDRVRAYLDKEMAN